MDQRAGQQTTNATNQQQKRRGNNQGQRTSNTNANKNQQTKERERERQCRSTETFAWNTTEKQSALFVTEKIKKRRMHKWKIGIHESADGLGKRKILFGTCVLTETSACAQNSLRRGSSY